MPVYLSPVGRLRYRNIYGHVSPVFCRSAALLQAQAHEFLHLSDP